MTLRQLQDRGDTITFHCAHWLGDRFCTASWNPGWDQIIQYFGLDFEISSDRERFLSMFECPKCGAQPHSMAWHVNGPGMGVGSHSHGLPGPGALPNSFHEESLTIEATLAHERRQNAEAHMRKIQDRKARAAIESGRDLIGPPSPWASRKRGRWF